MAASEKKSSGWFHCGHCGELFRARMGDGEMRRCDGCGRDPGHEPWEVGSAYASAAVAGPAHGEEVVVEKKLHHAKRRHGKSKLVPVVLLWILVLAVLVFLARWFGKQGGAGMEVAAGLPAKSGVSHMDQKWLDEQMPEVERVFRAHVVAADDAQRAQTILDPDRVGPRLVKFHEMNLPIRMDLEGMKPQSAKVLRLPEGEVIEVLWKSGDREYDSAFLRQGGEWKLDWEHFARYSEYPLSLFLAGSGPDEAEFRLFVRERLAEERRDEPEMSVVLYSAVAGRPRDAGVQTPALLVPRQSAVGKRLAAGFRQERQGGRAFGSQLDVEKPEDLLCVRLKLRRVEADGQRVIEIKDVVACHWYGLTDAPGVPE